MVSGQLYRVFMTMRALNGDATVVTDKQIITVGCSIEDVRTRLAYIFDFSDYDDYAITSVIKLPDRYLIVANSSRAVKHEDADAVIKRDTRSEQVFQKIEQKGRKFFVAMYCHLFAVDDRHAEKKFKQRMTADDLRIQKTIEEQAISTGFAMPRDVSLEANRAHIFRQ